LAEKAGCGNPFMQDWFMLISQFFKRGVEISGWKNELNRSKPMRLL